MLKGTIVAIGLAIMAMPVVARADYMFIWDYNKNAIGKYDLSTGAAVNDRLVTGIQNPSSIIFHDDLLYVAQSVSQSIDVYKADGSLVKKGFIQLHDSPNDMAIDNQGHLFVTELQSNRVAEYDLTGRLLDFNIIATGIYGPRYIATDNQGHLYVSSGTGIGKYSTSGEVIDKDFIQYSLTYQYSADIACDAEGYVYAGKDYLVSKYTSDGQLINGDMAPGFGMVSILAVDTRGNLFVAGQKENIGQYTTGGVEINPALLTGLGWPSGLAIQTVLPEPALMGMGMLAGWVFICRRRGH